MADASTAAELLGLTVGRHWPSARFITGLALTLASLGMLGLFAWGALVPFHYERSGPPLGEVCINTQPLHCYEVDDKPMDQAFEDRMNHSNRVIGVLGAITSYTALVLGWRLWRSPWKEGSHTVRRARTVLASACLSPLAAAPIFVVTGALYWSYGSVFE